MKIFISSLIVGFGPQRQAAKAAVTTLRHDPIMAEDFGAQPNSPQGACLRELRQSDLVVLVLGESYGAVQAGSGLSATHEEYREARGRKPVVAFVQQGVSPDPRQAEFITEVQGWEGGLFRGGFETPVDLQSGIIRALHDYTVANVVGGVDQDELGRRAVALLPPDGRNTVAAAALDLAISAGPTQRILRPVEIESDDLAAALLQSALFGPDQILDRTLGSGTALVGGALVLQQERGASVRLDEQGSLLIRLPLDEAGGQRGGLNMAMQMMSGSVILEEVVQQRLGAMLGYAGDAIERIDPSQRVTEVAIAARISGAEHRAWRTREQHAASPGSVSMGMLSSGRKPVVSVHRRAALRLDRARLVEDVLVPLRRQFSRG